MERSISIAHLRREQIARAIPLCPDCKEPLIFRRPDRRFIEDNRYVQCANGHVWRLEHADAPQD